MSAFTNILVDAHNAATPDCDHPADQLDTRTFNGRLVIICRKCSSFIRRATCPRCNDWLGPGGFCPTCDSGPGSHYARKEGSR